MSTLQENTETILHFILHCLQNDHPRHVIYQRIRQCNMYIMFLLSSVKAIPHLLTYINQINCFTTSPGIISFQWMQQH